MITFQKAYAVGDKTYATLKEAQIAAIISILAGYATDEASRNSVAIAIVEAADQVICALTTNDRSKPRARRQNGGSKPRKPKTTDATPQFKLAATASE